MCDYLKMEILLGEKHLAKQTFILSKGFHFLLQQEKFLQVLHKLSFKAALDKIRILAAVCRLCIYTKVNVEII